MSWHYLQEQEVVSSEDIFWDGEQFVQSKSKTTLGEYCLPDSETESFQDSQSGMTLRRSTETPGEAELMWYQGDSPVKTYLPQEKEQEYVESDLECGPRWPESLARYDPVTSSWRTAQCSLVEGLELYSEIFPRWGMMHDGEFWEQDTSKHLTSETESGFWLPTPTCVRGSMYAEKNANQRNTPSLASVAHAMSIPTPKARDWKDSTQKSSITAVKKGHEMTLGRWVHHWPTPQASDNRDRGHLGMPAIQRRLKKGKQLTLGMSVSDTSGALNPPWVEWLMGWPIGWTDLKPLAMDKFQQWQHLHGKS